MKLIFGLGNNGDEYKNTRHNTGHIIIDFIKDKLDKKIKFLISDNFMNNSGKYLSKFIKSKKDLKDLIVIYDDIDLPIGKMKISYNRSSGGHRGLASIIKTLKSEEFVRIRIGICPITPSGKIKKPKGEEKVIKFILGEFKKNELEELKKISKKVAEAIECIYDYGKDKAMSLYN